MWPPLHGKTSRESLPGVGTKPVLTCIQWISQHRNYTNFKVGVPPWFCESQTYKYLDFLLTGSRILAGPSCLRVLSDPWFCESQTYKYLGFPSSGSTFYTIFRTDFPRTTSPIKAYTWVDCGHNPPFSTIMKVGGGTTVYTCGRCIVFTPVTFWP
jgi:hypothetical protein